MGTTLMAHIHLSDPLAFSVDKYVEAVKKATGVAQLPEAVVKAFEIIVKYALPTATEIAAATAAIAKANGVAETQVQVAQGSARRLGARCLSMNVDVTITVPDKTQAAEVLSSASNVTALGSELGGEVSVTSAPATSATVETKVKSSPSAASKLVSQIESVGPDVGGTIKAEVKTTAPGISVEPSSNSASSNFNFLLVVVAIFLGAAL